MGMTTNYTLILGISAIFVFISIFGTAAILAVRSDRLGRYCIRPRTTRYPPLKRQYLLIGLSGSVSLGYYLTFLWVFSDQLIQPIAAWLIPIQIAACLLLYELLYYVMHRSLHHPTLMRWIHGTHHKVRYPEALDGLYINPIESLAGLTLLFASMYLIAPLHIVSFLAIAFIHSWVNIVIHTSLVFPHSLFRIMNSWVIRHDRHHWNDMDKNYSSIVPVWDWLFDTYK